mmetsp:Transcript_36022/g.34090  ORF Transcript_36022/g.34090 Transcript_36022/m.34090 type:complete len:249 (-) Transcript_36022:320-1066(-)
MIGVSISGGILSALIDEANSCSTDAVQQGVLFGNKAWKKTEIQSDTQEDIVVDECTIGIDGYFNFKTHHPFFCSPNQIQMPNIVEQKDNIVGLVVFRRDGIKSPSMRDMAVASYLRKQAQSALFPFLILIINIDSNQCSWIFGMSFSCFGINIDSPRVPFWIDLNIPSLSADSTADYKAATCLNSDFAMSSSSRKGLALGAATAIHYSVETELLAAQLVDDIQEATSSVVSLEMEVKELRIAYRNATI